MQTPPFEKVGVLDLESFFPAKERFELAMQLNNLLAAPGFEAWLEGEPLDPAGAALHAGRASRGCRSSRSPTSATPSGCSSSSLLLNQIVGWMRAQPGTTSLRALLYMDEIFGYFPPVANPPSKLPLLTLLKQARAFGLGVVLATQNPVDLDYKGLGNTGTWFLGRLQTERDKARVLDGLEGRGGRRRSIAREADRLLSALEQARVPDAQRARRGADRVRDALDDVVPARPAHARPDQDTDGRRPARRRPRRRSRGRRASGKAGRRLSGGRRGPSGRSCLPASRNGSFRPRAEPAAPYAPGVLGAARVTFSDRDARRRHDQATSSIRPA